MASYYRLIADLFLHSDMLNFHTAALLKHYTISVTHNKAMTEEDKRKAASELLLSALSVSEPLIASSDPLLSNTTVSESRKLAILVDLPSAPTREQLLSWILARGVLNAVYPAVKNIYQLLEHEFDPLHLSERVMPEMSWLTAQDGTLNQYSKTLRLRITLRVVRQLSSIYQTIEMKKFVGLCQPYSAVRDGGDLLSCLSLNWSVY